MQAVKEFTGYVIIKHKRCGTTSRYDVRQQPENTGSRNPHWFLYTLNNRVPCKGCGAMLFLSGGHAVYGRTNTHKCDARCLAATGPDCECSCGGENHGAGY
jgi:hypothetical protein